MIPGRVMRTLLWLVGALLVVGGLSLLPSSTIAQSREARAAGPAPTASAADGPGPAACGLAWHTIPSPNPGANGNLLTAVTALAPNNAWAVGYTAPSATGWNQTLIMHWDGAQWTVVPSPNEPQTHNYLWGVTALSPSDVWAVGELSSRESDSLILHWDGTRWMRVANPVRVPGSNVRLYAVSAVNDSDIWAVGSKGSGGLQQTFHMHWNGIAWQDMPGPYYDLDSNQLQGVVAVAGNDVWAVGYGAGNTRHLLLEHWNGATWSTVAGPAIAGSDYLNAVTAAGPGAVWAVGGVDVPGGTQALILHWDGTAWNPVASPNPAPPGALTGVSALAENAIWAVGAALIQWDGTAWHASANAGVPSGLSGVAAVSAQAVWAVGTQGFTTAPPATLTARYADPCAPPTATPTGPPPSPTPTHTGTPTITPTPCGVPTWTVFNRAGATPSDQFLAVAGTGPSDMWAVGRGRGVTLTRHWNGSTWTDVPSPNPQSSPEFLAVAALSPHDVWAVGDYSPYGGGMRTLAAHWNGTAWTEVPSPSPGFANQFRGVAAIAPNDIWAVGSTSGGTGEALIAHWDGTQWTRVPGAALPDDAALSGVTALSATNVWAVGSYRDPNARQRLPLVEHWDGTAWHQVASPSLPVTWQELRAVAAVSATDIWAIGMANGSSSESPMVLHWDGTQWRLANLPAELTGELSAVSVITAQDIWAVGPGQLLHWDGHAWTAVSGPAGTLLGVAGWASLDVWVVGYTLDGASYVPVAAHYALSSCTPAPPPPRCPGERFSDVCPEDYFYEPVLFLVTHDVISGYSDGTFRPSNATTRGQLAKIVVLAMNWAWDTQGGPHFSDVPPAQPFYDYIETAYHRGILGGYADGTFRPSANVTRGQVSKILVGAAGWPLTTAGGPHFSDVPPGSPFYGYVETAYSHGILSGYSDGTFLPGANATRGQIAKIVYRTVTGP